MIKSLQELPSAHTHQDVTMDNANRHINIAIHHVFCKESRGSGVSVQFQPSRAVFANIDHEVGKLVPVPFTTKVQPTNGKAQTTAVDIGVWLGEPAVTKPLHA